MRIVKVRQQGYGKDIVVSIPKDMQHIFKNVTHASVQVVEGGLLYKPIVE